MTADHPPNTTTQWRCPACGEAVDGALDCCWQCGTDHDGRPDPDFQPAVQSIGERLHCNVCGYLLRGLMDNRCPECGTEFDPEVRDTICDPPEPTDPRVERNRWVWLYVWLGAWAITPFASYFLLESRLLEQTLFSDAAGLSVILLCALDIFAPMMFVYWMFGNTK